VDKVAGRVSLATTDGLGTYWLPHFMPQLREDYPDLQLDLICDMRRADILRHEADVSVQYEQPTNAEIVSKVIGHLHIWPYASRAYAEKNGLPRNMEELHTHQLVLQAADQLEIAPLLQAVGATLDELNYTMARSSTSHYEMICRHNGIGILPTYLAFGDPDLVAVDIHVDYAMPIRLCYHEQQRDVARVRAMIDWLTEAFNPRKHPFFTKELLTPRILPR